MSKDTRITESCPDQRDPPPPFATQVSIFLAFRDTIVAGTDEHSPPSLRSYSRTLEQFVRRRRKKKRKEETERRIGSSTRFFEASRRESDSFVNTCTREIVNLTKEKPPIEENTERRRRGGGGGRKEGRPGYLGRTHIYTEGSQETYTKWIMGHRRNLATVTIPAIIFGYVYRGGGGGRGSETGELRPWATGSKGSSKLNLRI